MTLPNCEISFPVRNYNLETTLTSGQVFGWQRSASDWIGVVSGRWVLLRQQRDALIARTAEPQSDWTWLAYYLQARVNLDEVLASFPPDPHLGKAVDSCRGLRLLRQDPWECLASFILSSTKQIVQIQQIVALLRAGFGSAVAVPADQPTAFAFPSAQRIAAASETELRNCKMGFRAPYLLAAARHVANEECDLERLRQMTLTDARRELLNLDGVGEKIAGCVLLFAYGFPDAFPIDVWMTKALRRFYFRGRKVRPARLHEFAARHFGPNAGYAQQYLFHYMRTKNGKNPSPRAA